MQTIYRAVLTVAAIVFLLPISGQPAAPAPMIITSNFIHYIHQDKQP